MQKSEDRFFVALVCGVSVALALVIQPFFGAILWALVAALIFAPLTDRLARAMGGRRTTAASLTIVAILLVVVVPAVMLAIFIVREGLAIYTRISKGHLDINLIVAKVQAALPHWAVNLLDRAGLTDLDEVRTKITDAIAGSFQTFAARAFDLSQSAFGFILTIGVMLYLAFFLLRDGQQIATRFEEAIPLRPQLRRPLLDKIATVIRATVKGTLAVAVVQGTIGGLAFWFLGVGGALLWGIAMGFCSLVPAIGSALIWAPVAIYLLITGAFWKGMVLIFCGVVVIGMIDNFLRPLLVGRDTQMPDYMVFISTLGGIELFGINGIVIGPVIAALFMAVWDIFVRARRTGTASRSKVEPAEGTSA